MRRRALLASVPAAVAAGSAGCTIGGEPPPTDELTLSSPAFEETLPRRFTCDGEGASPPLVVEGVPDGTASLALLGEWLRGYDPGTIWTVWNLPPEDPLSVPTDRPRTERLEEPAGAVQGTNDGGFVGYRSPCHETPDDGDYRFSVLALDAELGLEAGAGRDTFDDAVEPRVVSSNRLRVTYERF
jgi:Raf kinase inhibitor-like YbhB/YbcL family protein